MRLQSLRDPGGRIPAFRRNLDAGVLDFKAGLFVAVSLPLALGRAARPSERRVVREAFAFIAERAAEAPQRLSHRDFQSGNLLARRRVGPGFHLGVIDFQGAWLAPPEYDLVSLLRDSYLELPDAEVEAHKAWVRPRLPDAPDPQDFATRFDLLTLARKAKDHARLLTAAQTGGSDHRAHLPPTVRALHAAARRRAALDRRIERLAELVLALPETPCAP